MNDFLNALTNVGIDPDGQLVEGKISRTTCSCSTHKKNRHGNGWYLFHPDTPATITWGCWKEDCPNATGGSYSPKSERTMSPEEREAIKTRMETTRREREEERQKVEAATREKAARLDPIGGDVHADHGYLVKHDIQKDGIITKGIKQLKDMLLVPMSETGTGTPASMQLIFPDGSKRFLTGTGAIPEVLYHVIKGAGGTLYVVEGYLTGLTVHYATGASVVVAFSSGRLSAVAQVLRNRFPSRDIVIAGDYGNGSGKAIEAARLIGGKVVIPTPPQEVQG
jgi:putative DNA primase/helicase